MADQLHPDWSMQEVASGREEQDGVTPEHTPGVQEQPDSEVQLTSLGALVHASAVPLQAPPLFVVPLPQPAASEIDIPTNNVIVYIILLGIVMQASGYLMRDHNTTVP